MARISGQKLKALKESVPVRQLAEARGVELRKAGKDLVGQCPFHEGDHEPSLHITPKKNLFHCFGCGAAGSNIDWVMKSEGVSFRHAVEILSRLGGKGSKSLSKASLKKQARTLDLEPDADDQRLLAQVVEFYHRNLGDKPQGLRYLEKRGLMDPEMLSHFRLGYSDRSLGYQLPRSSSSKLRKRLKDLGVLRQKTGQEHFRGSLVIPILGRDGEVLGMYGRKTSDTRAPRHLYLPGPHRGVFNEGGLVGEKEVIVCEALFDALTFWSAGHRNVTSAFGVRGFTEEMLGRLKELGVERVWIAFDGDPAGNEGARELAARLGAVGIESLRVRFPGGSDANSHALRYGKEALAELLAEAEPIGGLERGADVAANAAKLEIPGQASDRSGGEEREQSQPDAKPADPDSEVEIEPPQLKVEAPSVLSPLAAPAAVAAAAQADESSKPPGVELEECEGKLGAQLGDRHWQVWGLERNKSLDVLKVQLQCRRGEMFHLDRLDLYSARQRHAFVRQGASELAVNPSVIKKDLGRLLLALEERQEKSVRAAFAPKKKTPKPSDEQTAQALELLRDPRLVERILDDFEQTGVVGERVGKLAGYLAAVSRKLAKPLGIIIQSSSSAGKSSLMEAILSLMPEEETVKYSALTGQALYYLGDEQLSHKILCIAEEQGAQRATYPLKLLLSEGKLSIASTGKDPDTGKLVTHVYELEGPVMLICTTTAIELDEELQNRCIVITIDEGRLQTQAIHDRQRYERTLEGLWSREEKSQLQGLHQTAQRLLRPLHVVNPFAHRLSFLDDRTRTRRDHLKYLTLIDTIALLHQYQRPVKVSRRGSKEKHYIEVELSDIELAGALAHRVFGQTLDELAPQTRRFALELCRMVEQESARLGIERCDYRFRQRDARQFTGWSQYQVKSHLRKLVELEYVLPHYAQRGQSFVYELLYRGEGQDGKPFLMGLLDVAGLRKELGEKLSDGKKWEHVFSGWEEKSRKRGHSGGTQGAPRGLSGSTPSSSGGKGREVEKTGFWPKNAVLGSALSFSTVRPGRNGAGGPVASAGGGR